jgi:hypothetical protein
MDPESKRGFHQRWEAIEWESKTRIEKPEAWNHHELAQFFRGLS